MWYRVDQPLIVVTNETFNVWPFKAEVLTHGTITIEGGTNMKLLEGGPVHHAGFLEAWMDSVSFDRGQFFLVSFVGSDANGALNIAFQPHEMVLALERKALQALEHLLRLSIHPYPNLVAYHQYHRQFLE